MYKAERCLNKMDDLGKKLSLSCHPITKHLQDILDLLVESSDCLKMFNHPVVKKMTSPPKPFRSRVSTPASTLFIASASQGLVRLIHRTVSSLHNMVTAVDPRGRINNMALGFLKTQINKSF